VSRTKGWSWRTDAVGSPCPAGKEVDETECLQSLQGVPQSRARQACEQQSSRHGAGTEQQLIGDRCVREATKQPQQWTHMYHPLGDQHVEGDLPGPADQVPGVLLGDPPVSAVCVLAGREGNTDLALVQERLICGERLDHCVIREDGWPAHRLMKVGAGEPERERQAAKAMREGDRVLAASGLQARMVDKDLSGIIVVQHPDPPQPA
jgi:hypothetical protein